MRSNRGFTLSEILVSLVVISVGLSALCTLALFGFNEFLYTKNKLETQAEAMKFQYLLTSYLSQAVNVGAGDPNVTLAQGGLRQFDFDQMGDPGGDFTLIGTFYRDVGGRGAAVGSVVGTYNPSAIWWRRPTATTSGVVFFDSGITTPMTPGYEDQYIGRITELQFQREIGGVTADRLAALNVRVVFRFYRPGTGSLWCPESDIVNGVVGCANNGVVYVDLEKSFRVVLRNNVLNDQSQTGATLPDRALGLIYFFNPVVSSVWRQ